MNVDEKILSDIEEKVRRIASKTAYQASEGIENRDIQKTTYDMVKLYIEHGARLVLEELQYYV